MFSLKLRFLYRQSICLFLSLVLIITIVLINILPLPVYLCIVLVVFPILMIIFRFKLWQSTWGKVWVLSVTMLVVMTQVYFSGPITPWLLVDLLFLSEIILLSVRKKTQERRLHQCHIKTMRGLLRQNPPLLHTVDYTSEAIILLDNTGSIIESNPQASLLLALSESFLIGQPISEVLGILQDFQPANLPEMGEFIWKTQKDTKYLRFRTRPLLNHDLPSGTLLTIHDISEEKKSSEAYLQAAKLSIIGQVSAGLAHEIRNPLTTIKGFMQLITPEQWPEHFRPYQQLMLDEIHSIEQMLKRFVLVTSPSAPQMEPVNMTATIQALTKMIQPICLMQGVPLVLDLSAHSVYVLGDREQLSQALLSLLNNAFEASPTGGKVIIRITECETHVRISVIDNGPGIPENLRQRVLDPFFTTQDEGTGLGLTIAHKIVLAHHGKLHFSAPSCGAEVLIDLPCLANFTSSLSAGVEESSAYFDS
ncbi:MAG: ATP-binding protein [Desulfosporosinus sp.]|nr:ATP-binding protein [Desulfosporosinus sp.]